MGDVKKRKNSSSEKEFWVLPLPKWDRSEKELSIRVLASKQSIEDIDFKGKRVLCRVDYNVPIKDGKVTDPTRIIASLDSIKYMLSNKKRLPKCIVLICHLGRPGGKFKKEDFSLTRVASLRGEYFKDYAPVKFLDECVGPTIEEEINSTEECTVYLCENLRFHIEECGSSVNYKGEKKKAIPEAVQRFRKALTQLGDVYVFEAFGAAHRPHSSVVGIDLPQRVAGLLVKKELTYYSKVLGNSNRPFLAMIGGSNVFIAGGMAYTFKKVCDGVDIGSSLFDKEGAKIVGSIMEEAELQGVTITFPTDHVIADRFAPDAQVQYVDDSEGIPKGWMALDVGRKSIESSSRTMTTTMIVNGPLGVFEFAAFAKGTEQAMVEMVKATAMGCTTIIGGGDTGAASRKFKVGSLPVAEQISHASTGGGSSLVLMEGKMLPGVANLSEKTDLPPDHIDYATMWMETKAMKREQQALKRQVANLEASLKKSNEMLAAGPNNRGSGEERRPLQTSTLWEEYRSEILLGMGAIAWMLLSRR
eukprot:jgi/Bigna1/92275/estExt_fgenesh1_pm.C_110009